MLGEETSGGKPAGESPYDTAVPRTLRYRASPAAWLGTVLSKYRLTPQRRHPAIARTSPEAVEIRSDGLPPRRATLES